MSDQTEEEVHESQPLVEHLIELRNRLMRALIAIVVVLLSLIAFRNDIYWIVANPLIERLPENSSMQAIDITAVFLAPFKLTFFVSVFICIPYLLYQIWAFIAPALYKKEKHLAVPILLSSIVLFYAGVAFAYFVVFPLIFGFFLDIAPEFATVMPDITSNLNLMIKLFFAFGFAFEIPVATVILIVAGIISPKGLESKRPYVIVACFVFGMLMTPPDIMSQAMLAIPMWLLFEVGVFFGRIAIRDREKEESEEESA